MSDILRMLSQMGLRDAVDILVVSSLFYFVFRLIRGGRTTVPQRGFVLLLLLAMVTYFLALTFQLKALAFLIERLGIVLVLVVIVIFQSDLRRGLADLGRLRLIRSLFSRPDVALSEIVRAATEMGRRRVGALIAFERDVPLRPWIERGTSLEAIIRAETIRTIFTTPAPLHDGALIVRGDRLAAAGCILPLTTHEGLARDLGTRHRAALGLSEETDAVVLVVSEETGKISIAADGRLERNIEPETLSQSLAALLGVEADAS
ncbi:diadenylate cyclase CdaA [Candidatus Sumerlaeota bacterium]|nr:diadenylate cyclase CdaA [Candidatus Sumerlaeota bacterium]